MAAKIMIILKTGTLKGLCLASSSKMQRTAFRQAGNLSDLQCVIYVLAARNSPVNWVLVGNGQGEVLRQNTSAAISNAP